MNFEDSTITNGANFCLIVDSLAYNLSYIPSVEAHISLIEWNYKFSCLFN